METMKEDKNQNHNPTGKEVFVIYQCQNCGRNDCSCVPPNTTVQIPFWIPCDKKCGGFLMYQRAWIVEPYKASEVLTAFVAGDKKIIKELRPGGKFKEVTDQLDPDGTMDFSRMLNIEIDADPFIDEKRLKSKPKKNRKPISAKQVCPVCGNEFIIKDIELFLERLEEAWNILRKAIPNPEKLDNEIYKHNNIDVIKKCLKEKGYFTAFCQPCMSKISWSAQLGLGL